MIVPKHGYISNLFKCCFLNDFKQDTSNGWKACDVWDGRMIMFKPISCACDTVFKIT